LGAFEAHYGQYVTALAITPDGKQVVTGAHKTIKIWDLTLIQKKSKIKSITKHNSSVQTVAITPDGKQAISGDGNGTIIIWDIDSQKPLETLAEGYNGIKSIAVTPDGQKFVSTFVSLEGSYKGVQIWNFHNTKKLFGNRRAEREVETVAITPDSRYIVSGVYNSIIIWDLESPNIFRELYDPALKPITSVVITPDGKYIIAGTVENLLFVWDFKSGHLINVIELLNKWNVRDSSESVISLAVSPNSKQLISASTDGSLRLWDIAKGTELKNFSIHSSSVNSVVVTPSGKFAISADDTIKVWHLQTGKIVANFSVESSVLSCAVTSDGLTIVAGELSGRVHFLSLEGMEKFKERTPDSAL
jgi:WD40 repeat protein